MGLFNKLKPRAEQEIAPIEEIETPEAEPEVQDIEVAQETPADEPEPEAELETPAAEPEVRDIEAELAEGKTFDAGEVGICDGVLYESRSDGNCWAPWRHPAVWRRC